VAIDMPGIGYPKGRPDLMAPEPMGDCLKLVLDTFRLRDGARGRPGYRNACMLFVASNNPTLFASAIIGSATHPPSENRQWSELAGQQSD
jgi:hypothetical protein